MAKILFVTLLLASAIGIAGQAKDVNRDYFTDTALVDQNGKTHRLYSDLMYGKVVIVAAYHTDCTGAGTEVMRNLKKLQQGLGGRASEVSIIAVSVNPADDVVKSSKYAASLSAGPGWYFLTGQKPNVEVVLKKFGLYVDKPEDHSVVIMAGNVKTGLWKKIFGTAKFEDVQSAFESVLNDKGAAK